MIASHSWVYFMNQGFSLLFICWKLFHPIKKEIWDTYDYSYDYSIPVSQFVSFLRMGGTNVFVSLKILYYFSFFRSSIRSMVKFVKLMLFFFSLDFSSIDKLGEELSAVCWYVASELFLP